LTIESGSAEYVAGTFDVEAYVGPRIEYQVIQVPDTGQALELQYVGFDEGAGPVQGCLYHGIEQSSEQVLVNNWEVLPDPNNVYSYTLPIADDMPEGEYTLIGLQNVSISCPPSLDVLTVAYLAGQDPPAALSRFDLRPGEPEENFNTQGTEGPTVDQQDTETPSPEEPRVFFNLGWAPGCDRARPLALQLPDQGGCGPEVARQDLDWLTVQLREQGLLEADEWLEVVKLRPWRRPWPRPWRLEALAIRSEADSQLGWIRIGGDVPGSVWRTTYHPPGDQVGQRCWLDTDYVWECQK
jgi:hypothetical protein